MLEADGVVIGSGKGTARLDLGAAFGSDRRDAPLEVEVGVGKGRFLLEAARRQPGTSFLGIEYARALVRKVRDRVARERLSNVRIWHGDAKHVVSDLLPPASAARIHVYFPDPWPKRRHAKHRFFADPIPDALAAALAPGGELLLATDHDPYFREACARLACHGAFVRTTSEEPFAQVPPSGFQVLFEGQGIPVFRGAWQCVGRPTAAGDAS